MANANPFVSVVMLQLHHRSAIDAMWWTRVAYLDTTASHVWRSSAASNGRPTATWSARDPKQTRRRRRQPDLSESATCLFAGEGIAKPRWPTWRPKRYVGVVDLWLLPKQGGPGPDIAVGVCMSNA